MAATFARYLDETSFLARAVDPEVGLDIARDRMTGEAGQPRTSSEHQITGKHLTPRISNLTPWPYVAIALITTIVLVALGYAIYNCYRKTRTHNAGVGMHRISLIERRVTRRQKQNVLTNAHHLHNGVLIRRYRKFRLPSPKQLREPRRSLTASRLTRPHPVNKPPRTTRTCHSTAP
jgi:hypothetical protein